MCIRDRGTVHQAQPTPKQPQPPPAKPVSTQHVPPPPPPFVTIGASAPYSRNANPFRMLCSVDNPVIIDMQNWDPSWRRCATPGCPVPVDRNDKNGRGKVRRACCNACKRYDTIRYCAAFNDPYNNKHTNNCAAPGVSIEALLPLCRRNHYKPLDFPFYPEPPAGSATGISRFHDPKPPPGAGKPKGPPPVPSFGTVNVPTQKVPPVKRPPPPLNIPRQEMWDDRPVPVSYTHLTLPTILRV